MAKIFYIPEKNIAEALFVLDPNESVVITAKVNPDQNREDRLYYELVGITEEFIESMTSIIQEGDIVEYKF